MSTMKSRHLLVAALAALAACGGDRTAPSAPGSGVGEVVVRRNVGESTAGACWATQAALDQYFQAALFGGAAPPPEDTLSVAQAATVRLRNAVNKIQEGNEDVALNMAGNLKDFLAQRLANNQFKVLLDADPTNDAFAQTQLATMQAAIDYIVSDGSPPVACPDDLTNGGIIGVGGGFVYNDTRLTGSFLPPGALSEPAAITIAPSGPLPTDLTQYPLFFKYEARRLSDGSLVSAFNVPVDVAVCLEGNPELTPGLDLRLAHGTGGTQVGDVEILPPITNVQLTEGLACDPYLNQVLVPVFSSHPAQSAVGAALGSAWREFAARAPRLVGELLLPTEAHAAAMIRCCTLGGAAGSFSPFGGVDLNSASIAAVGPTSFDQYAGQTVAPQVRVFNNDRGTAFGLRGETVNWAVTGGGGSVTPATVTTPQTGTGLAAATWTIGANAGNALTATGLVGDATVSPALTVPAVLIPAANGNPVTFGATVIENIPDGVSPWRFGTFSSESAAITALLNTAGALPNTGGTFAKHPNCSVRAENTFIGLRTGFSVGNPFSSVTISITSDSDIRVWVDGIERTTGYVANQCPNYRTYSVTIAKSSAFKAGSHVVQVLGKDKANNLYFRPQITVNR